MITAINKSTYYILADLLNRLYFFDLSVISPNDPFMTLQTFTKALKVLPDRRCATSEKASSSSDKESSLIKLRIVPVMTTSDFEDFNCKLPVKKLISPST